MRKNKRVSRVLALFLALIMLASGLTTAWAEEIVDITTPTDVSAPAADEQPADVPEEQPAEVPEEAPAVIPSETPEASENNIPGRIAACGHAYVMTTETAKVYGTAAMEEVDLLYTITQTGAVLLATEYDRQADLHPVRVWFLTDSGETLTGYVAEQSLADKPLTDEEALARVDASTTVVSTEAGNLSVFVVTGEGPTMEEQEIVSPTETAPESGQIATPDVLPEQPIPSETDDPTIPEPDQPTIQVGDFVMATTNTRAFLGVDESASEDYPGDLTLGVFVRDAVVQVESIEQDAHGRDWYRVRYLYGDDFADGRLKWTETSVIYVLAAETVCTEAQALTVTDYAFETVPTTSRRRASAMDGFTLKNINGSIGTFTVGQDGVYGSSGKDSAYKQIASVAGHGTVYATPHYLDGYTVYCLEHNLPGPGENISGGGQQPKGPYLIVDIDSYMNTPGNSKVIYHESTMHAIAWVLRHTYPFMALDRSDADNETWSRVAGQFAIREVIKQLEGAQYVRDYWNMDNFYTASNQAPAVYLTYARWLAANGIARASITGEITVSNQVTSVSNGMYVGMATLTTDADLIRISKGYGKIAGHTAGEDSAYYYLHSGDTISASSANSAFSLVAESVSSEEEEASFLVGVPDAEIQKVLIPQQGVPYKLQAVTLNFEVLYGAITVTKTDASSGAVLAGATFELLNSAGQAVQALTTDASGTVTFSNLQPGTFTVREATAPTGYVLSVPATQTVTATAGNTSGVTFANEPIRGKIRIVKRDRLTREPLASAEFTITRLSSPEAVVATITTGADGTAETGWLPYDRYRVMESKVPAHYADSGFSTEIEAYENGKTYVVEVDNEPTKGYIRVTKTDKLDGTLLEGVQFDVYRGSVDAKNLVTTMTTDENGVALSTALPKGAYIVKERAPLVGYVVNTVELTAVVKSDETTYLSMTNESIQGRIKIIKTDELTGEALSGAEFTITCISGLPSHNGVGDGKVAAVITTDENGVAVSPLLTWGTYRVTETKVPVHFVDNSFSTDVTIDKENLQTYTVEAENEPAKGWIHLTKTDRQNGNPIEGVQFDIYYNDDYGEGLAATMITGADGIALSPALRKGRYIVKEHANPTGYVSELVTLDAEVRSDETTDLSAANQPIQGRIKIIKTDELTGEALSGAEFTITRISGLPSHNGVGDSEVAAVITTDENGVAVSPLLTWGTYRIDETKVPEHFVDNSFSTDVTIAEDNLKVYEIAVKNEPSKGWLRLTKTDRQNGNPIEGVQFDIYYNDEYGEGLAATMTTGADGVALSEPLRKGRYIVKEHGATAGYVFETVTLEATVKSDEITELTATNQPVQVRLKLYKRDAEEDTGSPAAAPTTRGDGVLAGAEFQVRAGEDVTDRQGNVLFAKGSVVVESLKTANEDASVTTGNLWPGLYEIVETAPPTGYQPSKAPIYVDARGAAEQSVEAVVTYEGIVTNTILYGAFAIVKVLGRMEPNTDPQRMETPEPGAEFAVYLKSAGSYDQARDFERDYLVTDERGYAMTKPLPYGVYTIRQTKGKDGYEIKGPIDVKIAGTENLVNPPIVTLSDQPIRYRLRFIKTDAATGKTITLAHASFKLKDAEGKYVTQKVFYPNEREIDAFTTDETGAVTLPETVTWGLYFVEEVTAPEGYLIRDEDFAVFVGNAGDLPGETYQLDIAIPNEPVKGRILLDKHGLQLTGFEAVTDAHGHICQQPVYEDQYLAGAAFEIRAAERIVGQDGTVWYGQDELVQTIATSAHGHDASKPLPLGKYYLVETEAPEGYVFDSSPLPVELTYADDATPLVEALVTVGNDYLPAEISLRKEKQIVQTVPSENDTITQSLTFAPGEGFVFGLYNDKDILYPGGTLMADTLIATGTTDENGALTFSGYYPHGDYYIRELDAPDGWKLNTECFPISLLPSHASNTNTICVSLPEAIRDELIYTPVTLTKTDITGEATVPGAQIEVRNSDGEIICRAYTDENGEIPEIPVIPGTYTFREVFAPEGFALNEAVMTFTVDAEGNVTGDTVIRDDYTRVTLRKQDSTGVPLEDVVFALLSEDGQTIATSATDTNGIVTFEQIPYGNFTIVETQPLPGYLPNPVQVHLSVDGTFVNPTEPLATLQNIPTEILVRKVDVANHPLPGAVFGLYDESGTLVETAVSDAEGLARFEKIPNGHYTIQEIQAPEGYLLSHEVVSLTMDAAWCNSDEPLSTFVNQLKRMMFLKVDTSGQAIPGVAFSLINAATGEVVETVTSDENGMFVFTQFDYGDWIVHEEAAPEGFCKMEDITFHVDESWKEPAPLMCVNIPNHYEFVKTDHHGNPMAGVKFALEDSAGNLLRNLVSGEDGIVHVTDLLPGSYMIREMETLEGFSRTDETIQITIDEHYIVPEAMKRLINYPILQTGVDIEFTPEMWFGTALMLAAILLLILSMGRRRRTGSHR